MRVGIVVDREFGERLTGFAARMPVWICDTPTNRPWVDSFWAISEGDVTRFTVRDEDGPEAIALAQLANVDLHHEWSELSFVGVTPTDALQAALAGYGADRFDVTTDGFLAVRPASRLSL